MSDRKDREQQEADIRSNVLDALANSERVGSIAAISIQVNKDVVRLIGEVSDQEARDEAYALAVNVPGVNSVENELIVLPTTPLNELPNNTAIRQPGP